METGLIAYWITISQSRGSCASGVGMHSCAFYFCPAWMNKIVAFHCQSCCQLASEALSISPLSDSWDRLWVTRQGQYVTTLAAAQWYSTHTLHQLGDWLMGALSSADDADAFNESWIKTLFGPDLRKALRYTKSYAPAAIQWWIKNCLFRAGSETMFLVISLEVSMSHFTKEMANNGKKFWTQLVLSSEMFPPKSHGTMVPHSHCIRHCLYPSCSAMDKTEFNARCNSML